MNAGAHKSDISSVLSKALILFEDGTIDWLTNKELEFSYRASVLQTKRPGIVLEAEFQLQAENVKKLYVACKIIKITAVKRNHGITRVQEVYFGINPICRRFSEKAGLRGYRIGGAQISQMHGNFIVNTEGASAQDVMSLIELIKHTIKDKFDVDMHRSRNHWKITVIRSAHYHLCYNKKIRTA